MLAVREDLDSLRFRQLEILIVAVRVMQRPQRIAEDGDREATKGKAAPDNAASLLLLEQSLRC